jgi:hypothetical protein
MQVPIRCPPVAGRASTADALRLELAPPGKVSRDGVV